MAHVAVTINTKLPARRWSRPQAITLSDTNADRNCQINGRPFRYIQNIGVAGEVAFTWESDNSAVVPLYFQQGEMIEGGYWVNARITDTDAGVELVGLIGIEGVDS